MYHPHAENANTTRASAKPPALSPIPVDPALALALDMADLGYAPIAVAAQNLVDVPLKTGLKDYRPKDPVGAWKAATADEVDVRKRFGYALRVGDRHATVDGPAIAVGVRTDNLCVIDLDTAKSDAVQAAAPERREHAHRVEALRLLDELLIACGEPYEAHRRQLVAWMMRLPYVRTPSGGRHIYFAAPEGVDIKSDTGVLGVKLVDIRGSGGYAAAPGAILADGRAYQPLQLRTRASDGKLVIAKLDAWPSRPQLPLLPEPLLSGLPRTGQKRGLGAHSGATGPQTPSAANGSGIASNGLLALDDFLPGDAAKIARALAYTPADAYDDWFAVRMALWRRVENEPAERREGCEEVAFEVFAAWSMTTVANNFTRESLEAEWAKGPEATAGGITAASIIDRASRDQGDGKLKRAADGRRRAMIANLQQAAADADARGDARLANDLNEVLSKLEGRNAVVALTNAGPAAAAATAAAAGAEAPATVTSALATGAKTTGAKTTAAVPRSKRFPGGVVFDASGVVPIAFPVPRAKGGDRNGLIAWADLVAENGVPKPTFDNLKAALAGWGFTVCHDEFTDRLLIDGCSEFGVIDDSAENALRIGLEIAGCKIKPEVFRAYMHEIGRQNRVHALRDYLDGLRWDGVPRVDRFWSRYFSVADTPLHRAFAKCWLIAAVRRAREPGTKFDFMPVLESEEGRSKSRAFAELAGAEWFSDNVHLGADSKAVIEATAGKWVIEVPELGGMNRSAVEAIKAQLSRQEDRARLAYARYRTDAPRSFVMVGTTNEQTYLHSTTGNRRFWPMTCGKVDWQAVRRDRHQIWAEAAYREAKGESIELDPTLWAVAAKAQETRRVVSADEEKLLDLINGLDGRIRKPDLYDALGYGSGRAVPRGTKELVAKVMREAGWSEQQARYPGATNPTRAWVKGSNGGWQSLDPHRRVFVPLATTP